MLNRAVAARRTLKTWVNRLRGNDSAIVYVGNVVSVLVLLQVQSKAATQRLGSQTFDIDANGGYHFLQKACLRPVRLV